MKNNLLVSLLLIYIFPVFSQDISKMNADFKLSDSLLYKTEFRIYQDHDITNYSSLLRIYEVDEKQWIAEFYEHYDAVPSSGVEFRTTQKKIKPKRDFEFIETSLERSGILHLTSFDKIRWKFKLRGEIEKVVGSRRGKTNVYYTYMSQVGVGSDGDSFIIQAKIGSKSNEFSFSNPDSYLKKYPEVDELNYIHEIMKLIREEFQIWKR